MRRSAAGRFSTGGGTGAGYAGAVGRSPGVRRAAGGGNSCHGGVRSVGARLFRARPPVGGNLRELSRRPDHARGAGGLPGFADHSQAALGVPWRRSSPRRSSRSSTSRRFPTSCGSVTASGSGGPAARTFSPTRIPARIAAAGRGRPPGVRARLPGAWFARSCPRGGRARARTRHGQAGGPPCPRPDGGARGALRTSRGRNEGGELRPAVRIRPPECLPHRRVDRAGVARTVFRRPAGCIRRASAGVCGQVFRALRRLCAAIPLSPGAPGRAPKPPAGSASGGLGGGCRADPPGARGSAATLIGHGGFIEKPRANTLCWKKAVPVRAGSR